MKSVFRESSIERLSNPEQLDRLMVITSPLSWLALIGTFLILVAVSIWGITGKLVTTEGTGGIVASRPGNAEKEVICFVPSITASELRKGMQVLVFPVGLDVQKYGHMDAMVQSIGDHVVSSKEITGMLGTKTLPDELVLPGEPLVEVICSLRKDSTSENGYYWSQEEGKVLHIFDGIYVNGQIVISEEAPITKVLKGH